MTPADKNQFLLSALTVFLAQAKEMVFFKDLDLVYVGASDSFARLVGMEKGTDLIGLTDFDIFSPALARKYTKDDRAMLCSGCAIDGYIEPLPDKNGKKSYSSTHKYPIRDKCGKLIGLCGVAYDVTAQMELELERENSRLSRQMFDSVLEADLTENRLLRVEGADWLFQLNVTEGAPFVDAVREVARQAVHPDHRQAFLDHFSLARLRAEYKDGLQECTITTCVRIGAQYHWMEWHSRIYHSRVSDTLRVTTFLRDVDEEVRSKQRLEKRADTDALTGLSNRQNVMRRIADCFDQEPEEQRCVMLFIDLDRFKQINDCLGHKYGDLVLQQVAEQMSVLFREDDVFGRIGGDEFLVFFRRAPARDIIERRARQIVDAVARCREELGTDLSVTCSVGVAFGRYGETTASRLYEAADRAMYKAKELGRNQVFFYEDFR